MDTTTSPGYPRRVAVTSIWQLEVQLADGSGVELGVYVVVDTCVVRKVTVDKIVDTVVLAGSVDVTV